MADKKNTKYVPSLRKRYKDTVVMGMMEQFSYKNVMEVPKVSHISINMGIGDAKDNPKKLESAVQELTLISCQKPVVTKSRKDISNFKNKEYIIQSYLKKLGSSPTSSPSYQRLYSSINDDDELRIAVCMSQSL